MTNWSDQKAMVARRSAHVGRLLRGARNADGRVARLDWSVAELGARLVTIPNRFRRMASVERFAGRLDMATPNARMIDEVAERNPEALARRFEEETVALLDALGDDPDAPSMTITVADGAAAFQEGPAERPDLTVSADPVAYLLVGYGRLGTLRPVLTGNILGWGRRPWLAARLPKFFVQP